MASFKHDDPGILKELQRVFSILKQPFTRKQFDEISDLPSRTVERRFGSWTAALEKAGLLKKFDSIKKTEKEVENFDPDEHVSENWEKEKDNLIARAEERKNKWLRQHVQKIDILKEMLEETLAKADPPVVDVHPIKVVKKVSKTDQEHITIWLEFSDAQLGTRFTRESMGGLNKHDWTVFVEKLTIWKETVIEKIVEYSQSYSIDNIVISFGGDIVEGVDIFKGQSWQVDRHVVDQAIFGANDVASALSEIFLSFPEYQFHILEVYGNHGRVGGKPGLTPYSCSMDRVFQRMLELQIKAVSQIKNCTWHNNEVWFYLVEIYGWTHLILHGDQGLGGLWSSRPTINSLEKGLARYAGMLGQQINFVHISHFHNDAQMTMNMSQVLINGSFVGTSEFSAHTMVASSPPVQVMHVFDKRRGLLRTERIYLTRGDVKLTLEPNVLAV